MAKRTLLDMTQTILASINGDQVNSIADTVESDLVARIIRETFFTVVDEMELPAHRDLIALEGLGDTNYPNRLKIPDNVERLEWIKYDARNSNSDPKNYRDLVYMDPHEFVSFVNARPSTDTTNYLVVQHTVNLPLVIQKTQAPTWWTSFDDEHIVTDSYNTAVDSTLQSAKSMAFGELRPTFTLSDAFIPDLPENLFGLLIAQAKATAFSELKQIVNPKAEQHERRMRVRSMRNRWRQDRRTVASPDYGRK